MENAQFAALAQQYRDKGNVCIKDDGLTADGVRRAAIAVQETCGGRAAIFSGDEETGYKYAVGDPQGDLRAWVKEKDMSIGRLIAGYVPDGACIQLGIGGIPNAVAEFLKEKNDLGVHTELITSGMAELVKMGVITNKCKQINRGQMVATMILGTQELYDFVDHNQGVALYDGAWVNDPYVIAQNDNQISINTSLEVDLTGQCASESIGSRQFSGTGGQSDTAVGAQMSKGGRSIIALYSTAMVKDKATGERHEVSKIVAQLQRGAAVSLSRNDVDIVITEYGAADLRGTNIRQRVEALINIAHPKFRDELWDQALACGIIGKR